MSSKIKKKRGRKPKGEILQVNQVDDKNSEEDTIIGHLPIKISSDTSTLFLKNESIKKSNDKKIIEKLNLKIKKLNEKIEKLRPRKKEIISVFKTNYDANTKCWWCKNCFDTPAVGLPENYFNGKFELIGCFCSFNCAKSYNIDLNDNNYWKRNTLLNYLYYKTYNEEKDIIPAPNWKTLKDFGGKLTIEQFRDDLITHTSEFLFLQPPIVSRKPFIEEIPRKNNLFIDKEEYYSLMEKKEEFVLKRSKPLKTNVHSLHNMLGLKKKS